MGAGREHTCMHAIMMGTPSSAPATCRGCHRGRTAAPNTRAVVDFTLFPTRQLLVGWPKCGRAHFETSLSPCPPPTRPRPRPARRPSTTPWRRRLRPSSPSTLSIPRGAWLRSSACVPGLAPRASEVRNAQAGCLYHHPGMPHSHSLALSRSPSPACSSFLKDAFPAWVFVGFYTVKAPGAMLQIGPYQGHVLATGELHACVGAGGGGGGRSERGLAQLWSGVCRGTLSDSD